jgi:hypothetical protein
MFMYTIFEVKKIKLKARKPAYQVTISERNRCSEAKLRMRYTQCSKGFAKQRLSYLPLADMAQTLKIVKERVGVDTLFWRRYFVTYGV